MIRWIILFMILSSTAYASNVACFPSGKTPRYLRSVNTPDYSSNPDCLINPLIPSVDSKYWKRGGIFDNKVIEMTQTEKGAVDLVAQIAREDAERIRINELNVTVKDLARAICQLDPSFTCSQLKQKIKDNKGL